MVAFWDTCKIGQPIQPIWQQFFALPWSALKKPSWELNFLHIFAVLLTSRHEKCFQILKRLLLYFTSLETYCASIWKNFIPFWGPHKNYSSFNVLFLISIFVFGIKKKAHFIALTRYCKMHNILFEVSRVCDSF